MPELTNAAELEAGLFLKRYRDPLSGREFSAPTARISQVNLTGRDPDFRPHYSGINPLHYAVLYAPSGFTAEESIFGRGGSLLFADRPALQEHLDDICENDALAGQRDLPLVCQAYERAMGCTPFLKVAQSEIAALALRASWMFMEWAESELASGHEALLQDQIKALRRIALTTYLACYENEDLSTTKLGYSGAAYLIAELQREGGELDEAARWYSRAVRDKAASPQVLRLARQQMEICREARHGS